MKKIKLISSLTALATLGTTVTVLSSCSKEIEVTIDGADYDKESSHIELNKDSTIYIKPVEGKTIVGIKKIMVGGKRLTTNQYLYEGPENNKNITDYKLTIYADAMTSTKISIQLKFKTEPEQEIQYIEVTKEPTQTQYNVDDKLNLDGMEVLGYYEDGTSIDITDDVFTDPDTDTPLTTQDTKVTVYYQTATKTLKDEFDITVTAEEATITDFDVGQTARDTFGENKLTITTTSLTKNDPIIHFDLDATGIAAPINGHFIVYKTLGSPVGTTAKEQIIQTTYTDKQIEVSLWDGLRTGDTLTVEFVKDTTTEKTITSAATDTFNNYFEYGGTLPNPSESSSVFSLNIVAKKAAKGTITYKSKKYAESGFNYTQSVNLDSQATSKIEFTISKTDWNKIVDSDLYVLDFTPGTSTKILTFDDSGVSTPITTNLKNMTVESDLAAANFGFMATNNDTANAIKGTFTFTTTDPVCSITTDVVEILPKATVTVNIKLSEMYSAMKADTECGVSFKKVDKTMFIDSAHQLEIKTPQTQLIIRENDSSGTGIAGATFKCSEPGVLDITETQTAGYYNISTANATKASSVTVTVMHNDYPTTQFDVEVGSFGAVTVDKQTGSVDLKTQQIDVYVPNRFWSDETNGFKNVTKIGNFTVGGATTTNVYLPNNLETIGTEAFKNCTGLTGITIPATTKYINTSAFEGCTGLTTGAGAKGVTFENTVHWQQDGATEGSYVDVTTAATNATNLLDVSNKGTITGTNWGTTGLTRDTTIYTKAEFFNTLAGWCSSFSSSSAKYTKEQVTAVIDDQAKDINSINYDTEGENRYCKLQITNVGLIIIAAHDRASTSEQEKYADESQTGVVYTITNEYIEYINPNATGSNYSHIKYNKHGYLLICKNGSGITNYVFTYSGDPA